MPSPLELIKKGIQEGSWEVVVKGYNALTGEDMPSPAQSDVNGFVKQIESALVCFKQGVAYEGYAQKETNEDTYFSPKPETKAVKTRKPRKKAEPETKKETVSPPEDDLDFSIENGEPTPEPREDGKKLARKVKIAPSGPNQFQDTLTEETDGLDAERKMYKKPCKRRDGFKYSKIDCEGCNKPCSVHPSLITRGEEGGPKYVCDKCIKGKRNAD